MNLNIPKRLSYSNKGSYGHMVILAGSSGMCGAAYLAALAAYRSGAGLVRIVTHEDNRIILQTRLPEAIVNTYSDDITEDGLKSLAESIFSWGDIFAFGPGLGTGSLSEKVLKAFLLLFRTSEKPLIMDADGLNLLSMREDMFGIFRTVKNKAVTPHPLEMKRLLHAMGYERDLDYITGNMEDVARFFSSVNSSVTLLKGHNTVVSGKDPEKIYRNLSSSPALSKGGSGDVLTGLIGGMYLVLRASQMEDLFEAARLSVIVHSEAGRRAGEKYGLHGVLASDTADLLGIVMENRENAYEG